MPRVSRAAPAAALAVHSDGERVALEGELNLGTLPQATAALARHKPQTIDLAALTALDTAGALFLCEQRDRRVELVQVGAEQQTLIDLIGNLERKKLPEPPRVARWRQLVIALGRSTHSARHDLIDIVTFIGRTLHTLGRVLRHPSQLRVAAISHQISDTGVNAMPIVALMAIMISIVIGYQSVAQLRPYGGEDFTINLVAVSVLREMGVLITAIMVAGRSGSAFTAEIGVMRSREEIDALQVMGLDPMNLLVLPRVIGLVIALPLLTFFADVMGLVGGAAIAQTLLGIAPGQYLDRLHHAIDLSDLAVGLIKAPVFAGIIAVVGCMHGLKVRGSAESVGTNTTRAVVKSIFFVIVLDALFSIFFERIGL